MLVIAAWLALPPGTASAHAELIRSDPPADGLEVTAPDHLTLTFTEDVVLDRPAPVISMLDESGGPVGASPLPIGESDDPRTLVVEIPDLDRGTYTVAWTVTSATDGHTLDGAFAFRVGGGLPPGLATSSDATPEAWAVATRWLTFLGVSIAAGFLLFGQVAHRGNPASAAWSRARARLAFGGAALALLATFAEPLIQWLGTDRAAGVSFLETVASFPDAWWWRPAMLVPLAALAMLAAVRPALWEVRLAAWAGATLALGSLLGLSLTSHAAGRESYRTIAIVTDILHQWSVALWTGGLAALAVWASLKPAGGVRLGRFSNVALGLFVIAVASGFANTGFIFPYIDEIRAEGWSISVFEPLWTSNYGVLLLIKLLVLIVPFALAVYHRALIARLGRAATDAATSLPGRFRQTIGAELGLVAIVILGGSAMAMSAPPASVDSVLEEVTLVASTSVAPSADTMLVHLTIDPAQSGDNALSVRLTAWDGKPIPADPPPSVTLSFTSLDHGTSNAGVGLQRDGQDPATYTATGLNLSLDGWWRIDARVNLAGRPAQSAAFYALLPDPNTQGFDAAPKPSSNPEAEALFNAAYDQMLDWRRVRWTETLGSGTDVLVRARFAVVDAPDEMPDAYSLDVIYSGGFAPNSLGEPPDPPTYDSRRSITIGDQGWLQATNGAWLEEPPTRFAVPAGWDNTYAGADNFRMGITEEIDGIEYQVITFYLPEQAVQSEAWFAWWINTSTGNVERVAMIARQHYMTWQYTDIDGDVTIEAPVREGQ